MPWVWRSDCCNWESPETSEPEFESYTETCQWCGDDCCSHCLRLHEANCDQNPDNDDDEGAV